VDEIEAKFILPDEETLQRLQTAGALCGYALDESRVERVRDTFLDTDDQVILAAGYALRQREREAGVLITLKGMGSSRDGIHQRTELETLLPASGPPTAWPDSPLRTLVLQLTAEKPLMPLLVLHQERVVRPVCQGERQVAELSLDRVRLEGGAFQALEAEVELLPGGSADDLRALAAALRDEWGLTPQLHSKFEQALAAVGRPLKERPGLRPDDSMAEAARKTLLFHFRAMLHHEPGTRQGEDPEALHDMRVATRRMRTALQVLDAWLDAAQVRPLARGLRRLGRALGAVRDLDVFWERVEAYAQTLPPAHQAGVEPLRAAWRARRQAARLALLAHLDSERYARFKARWGAILQTPGALGGLEGPTEGPYRLRHVMPLLVQQRLAEVQAHDEWVSQPDVPFERLHQLRIAAKKLRYTLEYFREVLQPQAGKLIAEIVELQDHLGAIQDAVVACRLVGELILELPAGPQAEASVFGAAYTAARQEELRQLLTAFPPLWARFRQPAFNRMVMAVLEPPAA